MGRLSDSRPAKTRRPLMQQLAFLSPALIVLVAVNILPVFYTIATSFQSLHLAYPGRNKFIGLGNYISILQDSRFWNSLGLTLTYVAGCLTIELILAFCIALLLAKQTKGVGFIRGVLLLPIFLTPIVVAFLWRLLFSPSLGLLNYFLAFFGLGPYEWIYSPQQALPSLIIIDIWQRTPELVLIIFTGLLAIPQDVIEAAAVDGASPWQLFWNVKVPLIKPILMVGILFRVIDLSKVFDVIYILTRGGPGISTETLSLYTYTMGFSFLRMGYASALGMILFAIILLMSFIIVRWGEVDFE
ncbi:MAG: sugar ABC transporter permease [Firmicutes bacterium]|nr:sugar ABC transporter permease [Bacillota bacterium]